MYLISVYFDEKTNSILQRYIDKIADVSGNTFMTEHQVPPHMTISAIEARSEAVLIPQFEKLSGLSKGKIHIVSVGQLLPYVFYAAPVLNDYLAELSRSVYDSFKDIPETSVSKYYMPGSWLAHITLGKTLSKEQLKSAFAVMQDNFQPIEATVTEIGLARVNPHEDVRRFKLK